MKFYKEKNTNNIVYTLNDSEIMSQDFIELKENTKDASIEKHTPVYKKENDRLIVSIGEVEHPMLNEHYIMWIALINNDEVVIKYLKPSDKPFAEFKYIKSSIIYSYCNLHGLWKNIVK